MYEHVFVNIFVYCICVYMCIWNIRYTVYIVYIVCTMYIYIYKLFDKRVSFLFIIYLFVLSLYFILLL